MLFGRSKRMMAGCTTIVMTAVSLSSGCLALYPESATSESTGNGTEPAGESADVVGRVIESSDAMLSGTIGSQSFDTEATATAWDEGDYTVIEILSETETGAVMHTLHFNNGGIQHERLVPGADLEYFALGGYDGGGTENLFVTAWASEGRFPHQWSYMEQATFVNIRVVETEKPSAILVEYEMNVPNGNSGTDASLGRFTIDGQRP